VIELSQIQAVANERNKINTNLISLKMAQQQLDTERQSFMLAQDKEIWAAEAQAIVQVVSLEMQEEAHNKIASVVSSALAHVFDDPYEFKIKFERKRGRTEATLVFMRDGHEYTNPIDETGGGAIDVAAFALRLACIVLQKPIRRRVMILDEPFKGIRGVGNRRRMRSLLETLADNFNVQFILNIDADSFPEFLLGTVIRLGD